MREVADRSVHLVVTSPPYWQLKDYENSGQIGFADSYEEYINSLNCVWGECHRALHDGCRLCINIGDQFARSVYYGRYKVIPIRTEIIRFCETIGFDYMGAIIWQKVTTCNTTGGATIMGSFPHPRNGIVKLDYEFILIFKKPGKAPKVSKEVKNESKLSTEEWNTYFNGHWNFPGERQDKHIAMFPEELPRRLIRMFSFGGETVLDPFLGSGTTSLAALKSGRSSIGYEVNPGFLGVIREKLGMDSMGALVGAEFDVVESPPDEDSIKRAVEALPYRFCDAVKIKRKVDPKKLPFGSRVDTTSSHKREDYYRVTKVISPEMVELDTGQRVRLIGIRARVDRTDEAVRFLREITGGQQVALKFDKRKHDDEGVLLGYLYLRNRTFVNAHLLKRGLAMADTCSDYRYRSRFESFCGEHEWQKSGS